MLKSFNGKDFETRYKEGQKDSKTDLERREFSN
jgi:hypothetical protein